MCVGVTPIIDGDGDGDGDGDPPCVDCAPYWRLYDFQPQSCGFEQTYGLDSFQGHVTLVALLAGWCSYCQSQALKMEQMRLELRLEGYDVQFLAINMVSADTEEYQQNLIERCAFPLFQDTPEDDAYDLHGGGKDDMYIYSPDGTLFLELPVGGDISTNLGTDEGYDNIKQALIDASG
ncbi:hypothetical protein ENSA5_29250 [Enhygromyxa salina]|uniref:Thioredoxin domain-containing protein n=1 Tax=Enhygromyxa salina TaxID=215803 RepID=A0A2S9Y1M7_9BACT|nr:hypothetical protein ENSA5_29250 [Enhygromyxa salina]